MIRIILIIIILAFNCYAADIHVGSGQTYTTVAAGITASSSGDTIYIHEGTYNELNLYPKANTIMTGVDGEDKPIIDAQQTTYSSDNNLCTIHISNFPYSQNDVTLNRLDLRNGARSTLLVDNGIDDITVQNCHFQVDDRSENPPDNAGLVWFAAGSDGITITNNTFLENTMEYMGVLLFEPDGATLSVENNNFDINSDGSHGIFIKHAGPATGRAQIKNNFIDATGGSGRIDGIFASHDNTDIKNNLIIGNVESGIRIGLEAGGPGGTGSTADHNTVYGTIGRGGWTVEDDGSETNLTLTNNILYKLNTTTEYLDASWWVFGTEQTITNSDYNHYFQNSVGTDIIKLVGTAYTLSEWVAAKTFDDNSINETQGFANGSGNLNTIADFEVVSGGGNNGASDGTDIGVDISTVGVDAGGESGGTVVKGGVNVSPGANIQ